MMLKVEVEIWYPAGINIEITICDLKFLAYLQRAYCSLLPARFLHLRHAEKIPRKLLKMWFKTLPKPLGPPPMLPPAPVLPPRISLEAVPSALAINVIGICAMRRPI